MIQATNYEGNQDYNVLTDEDVVDGLTSTSATTPLSANQGKVLKGLIDGLEVGTDPEVTQDINQLKHKCKQLTQILAHYNQVIHLKIPKLQQSKQNYKKEFSSNRRWLYD